MHDRAMSSKQPGSLKAYFKTIGERKTSKKRLLLNFEIFLGYNGCVERTYVSNSAKSFSSVSVVAAFFDWSKTLSRLF